MSSRAPGRRAESVTSGALGRPATTRSGALTPRDRDVLEALAVHDGSFADAADALGIGPDTVHNHVTRMAERFGLRERAGRYGTTIALFRLAGMLSGPR